MRRRARRLFSRRACCSQRRRRQRCRSASSPRPPLAAALCPAAPILRRAANGPWRTAAVYAIAGSAYAAVMTTGWLIATKDSALVWTKIALLFWTYFWPAVITVLLVAAYDRIRRVQLLGGLLRCAHCADRDRTVPQSTNARSRVASLLAAHERRRNGPADDVSAATDPGGRAVRARLPAGRGTRLADCCCPSLPPTKPAPRDRADLALPSA